MTETSEKPEYVYSLDGEEFFELDELEEDDLRNIAFRGIPVLRQHSESIRADTIIEEIQDLSTRYLDDITEEDRKEKTCKK